MYKQILLNIFFLLMMTFPSFSFANINTDFKLVESKHAINLYERWINHNNNKVRELKAVFTVKNATAFDVINLLRNRAHALKWNQAAKKYTISYTEKDNAWLTYMRYDIPWPLQDQDCCLMYTYNAADINKAAFTVHFKSVLNNKFPINKNITRITGTVGSWQVVKNNTGGLTIIYKVVTDKSMSVPRVISDPVIYDNLFTTMKNFRSLLQS